jgi:hypothetical protein
MTFIGCTRFKRAFKNLLNSGIYVPYYRKRQKTKL